MVLFGWNKQIVGATNKNLIELCHKGEFRWDLYYRLAVVELELPNFREFKRNERKAFIHFFIKDIGNKLRSSMNIEPIKLSEEAESWLLNYDFPGNIRELKHIIEGFYAHQLGVVKVQDFPKRLIEGLLKSDKNTNEDKSDFIWDWKYHEKNLIEKALKHFRTKGEAAKAVGYGSPTHFGRKAKEYSINTKPSN